MVVSAIPLPPALNFTYAILPSIHTTKLSTCTLDYAHTLNEFITTHQQGNQHCSLHSLLLSENPHLPRLPCSVTIKLQPPTTQLTLHACQHALPTPLPSTTFLFTQQTEQNCTRCRDTVKVFWCYSHLVWLVFEGSIPTWVC